MQQQSIKKDLQHNRTAQAHGYASSSTYTGSQATGTYGASSSSQTVSFTDMGDIDANSMRSLEATKQRQLDNARTNQVVPNTSIFDLMTKMPAPTVKVAKALTEEQKQRIEENRKKALEKRAHALQQQQRQKEEQLDENEESMFQANLNM